MAALFCRQNYVFNFKKFNSCFLLRLLFSHPYHRAIVSTEPFGKGKLFWKKRCDGDECCRSRRSFSQDQDGGEKQAISLVFSQGPFRWISNKIKLFLVHSYFDADFDEATFLEGAKQAVCTVSSLVSQRKFTELEGLLTDEAINSLMNELSTVNNIESYKVTMEDILQTTIHDIGFQYDESVKGKKWLHVMVSYIFQSNEIPHKDLGHITFIRIPFPRVTRYSFRKECTVGVEDCWIVTKVINLNQNMS